MSEESQLINVNELRDILSDEKAEYLIRQDDAAVGLLGDREVHRGWVIGVSRSFDQCTDYLETYTATKNNDPLRYVEDLVIQGYKLTDKWRHAFTYRTSRQSAQDPSQLEHMIVQVLRKGYIERLVSGSTLDWSEARIERNLDITAGANATTSYVGGDDPERYITVYWPNVSPFNAKTITDTIFALAAGAFVPVIKGDSSYGNAYHRLGVGHAIENDGSATIRLFLAKPQFVLEAYTTYLTGRQMDVTYLWNVPKELSQGILTAFKAKGRSATCNYSTNQMVVDIILYAKDYSEETLLGEKTFENCDAIEYTSYYWGIEDPTAYNIPDDVPVGYTYWKNITNNGDGSYDVIIRYRSTQYRAYWMPVDGEGDIDQTEFDADPVDTSDMLTVEHSMTSNLTEGRQYGVTDETTLDLDTAVQGFIKRVSINIRDDCSKDYVYQVRESYDDEEYVAWDTRNGEASLRIFINKRDAEWSNGVDAFKELYVDTLDGTTDNTVSIHFNEDGTLSGYVAVRPYTVRYYTNLEDGTIEYYYQKLYRLASKPSIIVRYTKGRFIGSLEDAREYANLSAKNPPTICGQQGTQPPGGWVEAIESREGKYIGWKETWENADGTNAVPDGTPGFENVDTSNDFASIYVAPS